MNAPSNIGLRVGNLDDLPPSLRSQLKVNPLEDRIVSIVRAMEGMATIDEIMVALYRQDKKERNRRSLAMRIGRMAKKGKLKRIMNRRGVYAL